MVTYGTDRSWGGASYSSSSKISGSGIAGTSGSSSKSSTSSSSSSSKSKSSGSGSSGVSGKATYTGSKESIEKATGMKAMEVSPGKFIVLDKNEVSALKSNLPDWTQVGKSSTGTPIFERDIGEYSERIATTSKPDRMTFGIAQPNKAERQRIRVSNETGQETYDYVTKLQAQERAKYNQLGKPSQQANTQGQSVLTEQPKTSWFEQQKFNLQRKVDTAASSGGFDVKSNAGLFGLGFVGGAIGSYQAVRHPFVTTKKLYETAKNPKPFLEALGTQIRTQPAYTLGGIAFDVAITKGVSKAGSVGKNVYVSTGSKYVEPSTIYSNKVLSGAKWETSSSTSESLKMFQSARNPTTGRIEVVHATGSNTFPTFSETITPTKPAAGKALETAGLYVAPKGKGSLYFNRVRAIEEDFKYSILPGKPQVPTDIVLNVRDIKQVPGSVRKSDDMFLQSSNKWLMEKGKSDVAYITPRFQAGGTNELEAVITPGTKIKPSVQGSAIQRLKGFSDYTTIEGKNIALRNFDIVGKDYSKVSDIGVKSRNAIDFEVVSKRYSSSGKQNKSLLGLTSKSSVRSSSYGFGGSYGGARISSMAVSSRSSLSSKSFGSSSGGARGSSIMPYSSGSYMKYPKLTSYSPGYGSSGGGSGYSPVIPAGSGSSFGGSYGSGFLIKSPKISDAPNFRGSSNQKKKNPFNVRKIRTYAPSVTGLSMGLHTAKLKKSNYLSGLEIRGM